MSRSATTTCGGHRALARAADLLDAYPRLAVLSARVLVGDRHEIDPACERMAQSPLDGHGLPGPALIAFMAGAYVVRVEAYRATGGYEPRFFLGAEEALMALDLAALGWRMAYAGDVVTHHHPSRARDPRARRALDLRNRIWLAWLRLPLATAWREARHVLRVARELGRLASVVRGALAGLPWALAQRRVVPPNVHAMYVRVFHAAHPPAGARPRSQGLSRHERV